MRTNDEFDLKVEEYFKLRLEKVNNGKQWMDEQLKILYSSETPSAIPHFEYYSEQLADYPSKLALEENLTKAIYNMYQISGYYHGTAVGPCKLSEFIADLDNPASNINQNIVIENLLDDLVANVTQTIEMENSLEYTFANISGAINPDTLT